MARARRAWIVGDRSFPSRATARAYRREHGIRGTEEYAARIEPKIAAGLPRAIARGHKPGGARKTPRHRTRGGAVVRPQSTIGRAGLRVDELGREVGPGEGSEYAVTVRDARRRLKAWRRDHPKLREVGVALHGRPYKERKGQTRWTGYLQNLDDLEAQLDAAAEDGIENLADVTGLGDRAAWDSIDELAFYVPQELAGLELVDDLELGEDDEPQLGDDLLDDDD